jgi:hypothetical protein
MGIRIKSLIAALIFSSMFLSCSYVVPYVSLDVKFSYSQSDVTVNYTYVCESTEQRCVYRLYNKVNPSEILYSDDGVLPVSGSLSFSGLAEGDYMLFFSVYSEKDGRYSLLSFLDTAWAFTVDLP